MEPNIISDSKYFREDEKISSSQRPRSANTLQEGGLAHPCMYSYYLIICGYQRMNMNIRFTWSKDAHAYVTDGAVLYLVHFFCLLCLTLTLKIATLQHLLQNRSRFICLFQT